MTHNSRFPARALALALFFGLSLLPTQAQKMAPDAPIENFQLPMYDEDTGYRTWLLKGIEGRYGQDEQFDVLGMVLTTFSADEAMREQLSIRSPEATLYLKDNRATGLILRIEGDGFTLAGKDWTWDGEAKRVTIERDAKVTFNQNLSNLIK